LVTFFHLFDYYNYWLKYLIQKGLDRLVRMMWEVVWIEYLKVGVEVGNKKAYVVAFFAVVDIEASHHLSALMSRAILFLYGKEL
jgi:hypothetical protein